MKSWKTTLAGVLTIVAAGITMIALPILDGNAETSANFGGFLPLLMAGVAALFARDNDKTSEDVKAK